jgi:ubiquinone/menaquinone biosynthesis C-methylase UbiE
MAHHGRKFDPAMRDHLLARKRARSLPAKEILSKFPIKVGGAAVDIGCGPGYWTIPMAKLIGPSGRVYAVDLEGAMLATLRTRLEMVRDLDIQVLRSTEDRLPLPARSVDFAFLACVLHELEGPGTLREAARVLRPGGILGIVEWKKIRQLEGPPYRHRLSPAQAAKVLGEGGFDADARFEAGPYHYGIIATPRTG